MSLQDVEQAAAEKAKLEHETAAASARLQAACLAAIEAGVPIARVARSAGVTRTTVYSWIEASEA